MALDGVVQVENVPHLTHLAAELLVVVQWVLRVRHRLVLHQIVHNHHLLLDHRNLPIELVEHVLDGQIGRGQFNMHLCRATCQKMFFICKIMPPATQHKARPQQNHAGL